RQVESISACLFLATKVADETRKIRDILNCWKETEGNSFDVELTKEYYQLKERIVECEQVILRTFVFDVETRHPYCYFLNCCKSLKVSIEVIQCGWSLLLDSYLFHIREEYEIAVIAISSIYLALQMLHQDPLVERDWWTLFDVSTKEMAQCCGDLLSIYE
ncbi:hypothetical protein WA171_003933, partial [Blastocystis sp. BT1]